MIITAGHAQWTSWVYRQDRAVDNCQGNVERLWISITLGRSPSPGACNYPIFLSWRFHKPIFFSLNLSIPTGTSVTNCNHRHGLMFTCRHVHVRPHCFILTEAYSCRLELAYFAVKISKNRLVCKNAVVMAYYGSCRLLVLGPCFKSIQQNAFCTINTLVCL